MSLNLRPRKIVELWVDRFNAAGASLIALIALFGACGSGTVPDMATNDVDSSMPGPPPELPKTITFSYPAIYSYTFAAKGGTPPYSYTVVSGEGTIDPANGVFVSRASHGSSTVHVTDATGQTAESTVSYHPFHLNDTVSAAQIYNGAVYAFGKFDRVNPIHAPGMIALNRSNGAPHLPFDVGGAAGDRVAGMVSDGKSFYLIGSFFQLGGRPSIGPLAKIDLASAQPDATFTQNTSGKDFDGFTAAVTSASNTLYVGGDFSQYGTSTTISTPGIAKFSSDGQLDTTFASALGSGIPQGVRALAATADALYVGGSFTQLNGTAVTHNLIKLSAAGALDLSFQSQLGGASTGGCNDTVRALLLTQDALYAVGDFTQCAGLRQHGHHPVQRPKRGPTAEDRRRERSPHEHIFQPA